MRLAFGPGYDPEVESGLKNMTGHRRLCHAVLSSSMDAFHNPKAKFGLKDLHKWIEKNGDHDAIKFFQLTKPIKWLPTYRDRTGMALCLSIFSPKLQCLAAVVP